MNQSVAAVTSARDAAQLSLESAFFNPLLDLYAYLPITPNEGHPRAEFRDSVWDLTDCVEWPGAQRPRKFDWRRIQDARLQLTFKEVAVMMMQPAAAQTLGVIRRNPNPRSPWALYHGAFQQWVGLASWMQKADVDDFSSLTQTHIDIWISGITSSKTRQHAVAAVRVLSDFAQGLTFGGLGDFRPFGELSNVEAAAAAVTRGEENSTPEIPDEVFIPVLKAALYGVARLGESLGDAKNSRSPNQGTPPSPSPKYQSGKRAGGAVDAALTNYLADAIATGQPLPQGSKAGPSLTLIAKDLGLSCGGSSLRRPERRSLIEEAFAIVGSVKRAGSREERLNRIAKAIVEGKRNLPDLNAIDHSTAVAYARQCAYVVVACLTGMRHSELGTVTGESVLVEQPIASIPIYRIRGRVLKGRRLGGREETWLTIKETALAIELAANLAEDPTRPVLAVQDIDLRKFVDMSNRIAALIDGPEISTDWRLYGRLFRRKVARVMARRNHGILGVVQQLKHASVQVAEGYAGRPGGALASLQREIEQQRAEINREEVERIFGEVVAGRPIAGLGARALVERLEEAQRAVEGGAGSVREEDVLTELLRDFGASLHTGPVGFCWFRHPDLARCLVGHDDKSAPLLGSCQPSSCINATIHPQHVPVWASTLDALEASLVDRRIPAGEKVRLKGSAETVRGILADLGADSAERLRNGD